VIMRPHNLPTWVSIALALVLFTPRVLFAQYAVSTVAGGGPNNLTALKASIGSPGTIALDSAGNSYIADSYSSQILKVDTTGTLTVVAGNGTVGYSGDGGPATSAALNAPEGVFVDASGNIFIADTGNSVIREVAASNGNIATVAGNGKPGYSGDGGPATSAQLDDPYSVFVDGAGNIFIADTDNCVIRKVTGGNISTYAGNTVCSYGGDGGLATSAQLDEPEGVFADGSGNIFVADTDNSVIREVTIADGNITTVAGVFYDYESTGTCTYSGDGGAATAAYLCLPAGVFVDGTGDIFIADTGNLVIREVVAGTIATVAGDNALGAGYSGDGRAATSAQLNYPNDIFVDGSGDIFIADTDNSVIREVTSGTIQTVIGNNTLGYSGDGGPALNAELNFPGEVSVDGSGDLFIADTASSAIREVVATTGDIQTVAGNGTDCADPTTTCGDGAAATSAQLNNPYGMFLDAAGNIYIADTGDNRIRVVNTGTSAITVATVVIQPGDIATVAGNGTEGYSGDSGPAISAEVSGPFSVFVDSSGNIFIADTGNSVIREVASSSGTITTVAGNGTACASPAAACGDGAIATSAQLNSPAGLFVDAAEDIFIADTFDNRIREVTASNNLINTVAGTGARGYAGDGAAATSALLDTPYGLFVDTLGDIFIADTENAAIREVVAATGFIQTVAGIPATVTGTATPGFSGDGTCQSISAQFNSPSGLFSDSAGDLFVADTDNSRVRKLVPAVCVVVTPSPINVAVGGQQQFTATVTGVSNTSVTWEVNGMVGGNATVGTISTTGLFQAPATIPAPPTVTITAVSNANTAISGSAQATIVASGGAVKVTVNSSPAVAEIYTGTTQTFSATVTGTNNTAVNWQVNGVPGGNQTLGTISSSGLYSAPAAVPTAATIAVKAVSQADSSAFGVALVLIVTEPTAADPPPQTTSPGGSVTYSLLLNEGTGDPNYALKLSCLQSTLPPGATCSFSPSTIKPATSAVSFSLTITVPSGSALLEKPKGMRLQLYFAFVPLAGILFAGAGGRNKQRRWLWLACLCILLIVLNACGGGNSSSSSVNPELGTYNVQVQGTSSAQPNPVTITTAGLSVQ